MGCSNTPCYWIVTTVFCILVHQISVKCVEDGMDDFPLDADQTEFTSNHQSSDFLLALNSSVERPENFNLKVNTTFSTSANNPMDMFNQIVNLAMKKPGAKERLAQVLPIIRSMSPTQRLTLATLVLKQLTSSNFGQSVIEPINQFDKKNSELMLPISVDIATMLQTMKNEAQNARSSTFRMYYHNPLSSHYVAGSFQPSVPYHIRRIHTVNDRRKEDALPKTLHPPYTLSPSSFYAHDENQSPIREYSKDVDTEEDNMDYEKDGTKLDEENEKENCDRITPTLCLETTSYPNNNIVKSIENLERKHIFDGLLADFKNNRSIKNSPERQFGLENQENALQICPSEVRYARPKKAKSVNGTWKFIVNTDYYTQTIRIETCLNADKTCSFLAKNIKSRCTQIHNYHRLLTWDEKTGLSLDLFKIPTCCSCQVQHTTSFPNLKQFQKADPGLQENITDESIIKRPLLTNIKMNNDPNLQHDNPRRESSLKHRKPSQPILPLRHMKISKFTTSVKHPQINNFVRRLNSGSNSFKAKGTFFENVDENIASQHRINYNYHPIIDFFKSTASDSSKVNLMENWLPITEGPRIMKML